MYTNDLQNWIDCQDLMASCPNSGDKKWTTGNPLLESGIAILIARLLSQENNPIIDKLKNGIQNCQSSNGLFNKNPDRFDQITKDDLIGATVSYSAAKTIILFEDKHFFFTNTDKVYWDSFITNIYRAYFKFRIENSFNFLENLVLISSLMIFPNDTNSIRLNWIILENLKDKSHFWAWMYKIFIGKVKSKYGSMKNVMISYYNDPNHIFCIYCPV